MIKPTIIQLCDSPFVGGPEKQILGQCVHIDNSQFDFLIASFTPGGSQDNQLTSAARSIGLRATCLKDGKLALPGAISRLCAVIRRNQSPLLISHGFRANFVALCAGLITKVPFVAYFHGRTGINRKVRFYEQLDLRVMRRAMAVVTVCRSAAEDLQNSGIRSVRVIPNAVDIKHISALGSRDDARAQLGLADNEKAIGTVGRLSIEKGQCYLLEAAREVMREYPACKLIIIGDGPLMQVLVRKAERLGIVDKVIFTGFRSDAVGLMKALDVFVLPSLTENSPVSLLEAMACGVSSIATDVGGVREVLAPAGIEPVPPQCSQSLTRAILMLLKSDSLRAETATALETRAEEFTFERQSALLQNLLISCVRPQPISYPGGSLSER